MSDLKSEVRAFLRAGVMEGLVSAKLSRPRLKTGESKLSAQIRYCSRFPLLCDCSTRNGMLRYLVSRMNNRMKVDLHTVCLFAVLAKIKSA